MLFILIDELYRFADIRLRLTADFPLYRQVAGITDILERLEIRVEIHLSFTQGDFAEKLPVRHHPCDLLVIHRLMAQRSIYVPGIGFPVTDANLHMRVDDIILKQEDTLHRIVPGHHNHIRRIEIDGHPF